MIEEIPTVVINMRVISKERAVLDCGCACYVGLLLKNPRHPATAGAACSEDHRLLMRRHNLLLKESTVEPQIGRPLVEVADELLEAAAKMEEATT